MSFKVFGLADDGDFADGDGDGVEWGEAGRSGGRRDLPDATHPHGDIRSRDDRQAGPTWRTASGNTSDGGAMLWLVFRETYLERLRFYHPGSDHWRNVQRLLERFTRYRNLAGRTLESITGAEIEAYIRMRSQDKWRGKTPGLRTLNNEIEFLNTCFLYAGPRERGVKGARSRLGLLADPPYMEPLAMPEPPSPVALSESQIRRFLEIAAGTNTPRYANIPPAEFWAVVIVLGLVTSLRRRALLEVPRPDDDILLGKKELPVPSSIQKTRIWQHIPLTDDLALLCSRLPSQPGEPLLPWRKRRGAPMSPNHFSRSIRDMQIAAGIPSPQRLRFKNLRSTAATLLVEQTSPEVAKRRLGHTPKSNIIHTNYVAKRISPADRAATELLADVVTRQVREAGIQIAAG